MTLWFHVSCGAYKRPEAFVEAAAATREALDDSERLKSEAERGIAHRRLPRVSGAQRAPTGRARCRSCREAIAKGDWRIPLVYYQEGRFEPSGFVHVKCSQAYFETTDLLERLKHFAPDLSESDLAELQAELESAG